MTVICTDGRRIASDSCMTNGYQDNSVNKIFQLADGRIVGVCGDYGLALKMVRVLNGEMTPKEFREVWAQDASEAELLIAGCKKRPHRVWKCESWFMEEYESSVPAAVGSGALIAVTALKCGKTLEEAVELAIELDPYCKGRIRVWNLYEREW